MAGSCRSSADVAGHALGHADLQAKQLGIALVALYADSVCLQL